MSESVASQEENASKPELSGADKPAVVGNEERGNAAPVAPASEQKLSECPPHNTMQLLSWLQAGESDNISLHFIRVLEYIDKKLYVQLGDSAKYYVHRVAQDFLYIMAQSEYVISPRFAQRFVELNTVIANLIAMSPFETTDHCLDMICNVRQSKDNAAKVCALYSSRNRKKIDRRIIVNANPTLASLWYTSYMGSYTTALADKECLERMRDHILFADDRLDLTLVIPRRSTTAQRMSITSKTGTSSVASTSAFSARTPALYSSTSRARVTNPRLPL